MKNDITPNADALDRRRFVAASCLGLVAGLTATQGAAAPRDPVARAYERYMAATDEFYDLGDLPGNEKYDTPEMLILQAERADLEAFIATTPPATIEGACAKLRWVASEVEQGIAYDKHGPCLSQAIMFLEKV